MSRLPYLDAEMPAIRRADDLLARMTVPEKAGLLFHTAAAVHGDGSSGVVDQADSSELSTPRLVLDKHINHFHLLNGDTAKQIASWHNHIQGLAESSRLGIPITVSTDPRHGVRSTPLTGQTMQALSRWPEHTGFGAIGDEDVVHDYADVVRRELLAMGIRVYLGPMADIFSDPRWSRGYGTFGEDVDTVTRLTAAFIRGLRGSETLGPSSVAAVVKHFPGGGPQQNGNDAHDRRYREQVYPGRQQQLHLRPFEAAIAAGVTQVMPYYGMPIGTDWDEVGFAFNRPVINDLLRGRYGFNGIVCTDWWVIDSATVDGAQFGPNGYGLEHLTPRERLRVALEAGVDQFGGDHCAELIVELVDRGELSQERLDESAHRLLTEKFRLGLFENRRVDVDRVHDLVGTPANIAAGRAAQQRSLVLLTNKFVHEAPLLPLQPGTRIYAEGVSEEFADIVAPYGARADSPDTADVNLIRLLAPWEHNGGPFDEMLHSGTLEFPPDTIEHVRALARLAPTIVVVYLERPAILAPLRENATTLIGDFGADDSVLVQALFGHQPIIGTLPFDLPASTSAVNSSREDVPFDTTDPLFSYGTGLQILHDAQLT